VTGALRRNLPSVFFSLLLNAGVLFGLALLQRAVASQGLDLMLESVFSEEIPQEEMTRDRGGLRRPPWEPLRSRRQLP
jgi:hypothetical protein